MKLTAPSYWALLEGSYATTSRTLASISRSIHTTAFKPEAWNRDSGSSSGYSKSQQSYERRKGRNVSDTILTASRLSRHANSISKDTSDKYSGWKHTPGPSTRRNVGRPKLSRDAGKSMSRAIASDNVETLLGPHSAAVLTQPLLSAHESTDGFDNANDAFSSKISSRDFITPRRDLKPGDFVEIRRMGIAVGIVLPPPSDALASDQQPSASAQKFATNMKDLYVLVTSGEIVQFRQNDIMMQIPGVIEKSLVHAAAALSQRYVVSTNSLDDFVNRDGSHDAPSPNSRGGDDSIKGGVMEAEPIDVPRFEARASILNKLRILERQKEKELQRLLPSFQTLFLVDAPSQTVGEAASRKKRMDLRTGAITTFEAARLMHELSSRRSAKQGKNVGGEALTASTVYAAHSLLMSHATYFLADGLSHRTSQLFTCRSDAERANLQLIAKWIAGGSGSDGQEHIDSFCSKASKIRQYADDHPRDTSGPPRIVDAPSADLDITWTAQDKAIIEFLQTSLGSRREVQEDTHGTIAMKILKRAGGHFRVLPYPDTSELLDVAKATEQLLVDDKDQKLGKAMFESIGTDLHAGGDLQHALVMRFLTSIGAMPPWHNPTRLDASFRRATMAEDGGEPEREHTSEQETGEALGNTATKYGLSLDERVEDIRHDFGQSHTVYVVDDEGAFELDDGISIEPVQGKDQAWVHIHVADPTAWIQPDDDLAQRAERRFRTLYFPEARWAMLPDDFVRGGVGLRSSTSTCTNGGDAQGQRVMTFSALLDLSSGLVQDTKVRPAIVYDVQTISYNQVGSLLTNPTSSSFSDRMIAQLSQLLKLAVKLSEARTRTSGFVAYRSKASISVSPLPLPSFPVSVSALHKPYFFAGFPTITANIANPEAGNGAKSDASLAQFLVAEMMVLAGRIAASFGKQHNLALAYRYQYRPESLQEAEQILAMRTNLSGEKGLMMSKGGIVGHGLVSYEELLVKGLSVSRSGYSVSAGEHFSLGITGDDQVECSPSPFTPKGDMRDAITNSGYVRATSPLRRYSDMLLHWQIKHQLIHNRPRFPSLDIARLLPQLERQEGSASQLSRNADRFWLHALIQRSLLDPNFKDEKLIGPWTAQVILTDIRVDTSTLSGRIRVNIKDLAIPADLEWHAVNKPPVAGDVFKVAPVGVVMAGIRSGLVVRRV
ncbi:related to Exoribonuclease II [Melanopsichium pennsylvanicum]|uniref:Related to Exoribonuclease II n=2 Tax=Melanopsichium pennsylvanicum TaxID=63383 RepID=A0AAJ4XPS8_9BASI|nr:related to Exoribonuclease II [Melanopsichium pennsylvanicum 4]SNX85716.1 related to Exoribonuclease II [Melanopsichium pennsylvanicum]